ncbi:hypothetical protein BLJ79_04325 [Arthrobacter sp. UCD-GKA]|uniref:hypothetical protein n=1 Tax=Arthrobacter sp. UCD-GKA TaxID=1913576 RepID=UPI0008DDE6D9|nr:hypothetical protein [Arthrobacter sp. UCD-GKA]OIH86028.1 hypothetical protein BLJ79_04325 [Arthrobacter sp. UCD-GKA]
MTNTTGNVQHKRGHNTIMTGLAMLVMGIAVALAGGYGDAPGLQGFAILVAIAGLVTLLVGVGRRRETPTS